MNLKRILCLVLTAPAWLLLGVVIYGVVFPLIVVGACVEYGFTGVWDPPWGSGPFERTIRLSRALVRLGGDSDG